MTVAELVYSSPSVSSLSFRDFGTDRCVKVVSETCLSFGFDAFTLSLDCNSTIQNHCKQHVVQCSLAKCCAQSAYKYASWAEFAVQILPCMESEWQHFNMNCSSQLWHKMHDQLCSYIASLHFLPHDICCSRAALSSSRIKQQLCPVVTAAVGHTASQDELEPELRDNQRRTVQVKQAQVCFCSVFACKQR